MEKQRMDIPETADELFAIFAKSTPVDEGRIFSCKCCGHRGWYQDMRGIQYTPKGQEPERDHYWYYCVRCLDLDTWQFILSNDIDVRILNARELQNIQAAFYDGTYEKWRAERGQG